MVDIIIKIPDDKLADEIDALARKQGHPNTKALLISFLRGIVRNGRGLDAIKGVREKAEKEADQATSVIA